MRPAMYGVMDQDLNFQNGVLPSLITTTMKIVHKLLVILPHLKGTGMTTTVSCHSTTSVK